jgi:archaellum component FlaG (FlaF/FlaG flagellin family)
MAPVGWVVLFDPTDPNANSLHGVTTLSILVKNGIDLIFIAVNVG